MKKKYWLLSIIVIIILAGAYFLLFNNRYGNIAKIEVKLHNEEKTLIIKDKKQISSFMKSISSGKRQKGMIFLNDDIKKVMDKVTVYFKDNNSKSISILLGDKEGLYYFGNDSMTGYDLPEKENRNIKELINSLENKN